MIFININIDVNNDEELNLAIQQYAAQGYNLESNISGTAIMKKKGYNTGILIILILFFLIGGILYYILSNDDVVVIRNTNSKSSNTDADLYCSSCGTPIKDGDKFCIGCGKAVESSDVKLIE